MRILTAALGAALVAAARGAAAFTILIDPGHGGGDPGAMAGDLREAELVLTVAERLAAELQAPGVTVAMTRRGAEGPSLEARLAQLRAVAPDLVISIHADALAGGPAASGLSVYRFAPARAAAHDARARLRRGPEAWVAGAPAEDEATGAALIALARRTSGAESARLSAAMIAAFREAGLKLAGRPERAQGLAVLSDPATPGVLVELGFLSTPADRARLTSGEWQARAAAAIAAAITNWRADAERF